MGSLSGLTDSQLSVIYDTNTFISAVGWDGKPEDAIKIGFYDDVKVYVSRPILNEYERVLDYDRVDLDPEQQRILMRKFRNLTDSTRKFVPLTLEEVEDDPDDDKFLELAVIANADYIISGDSDLKELEYYEYDGSSHDGTQIISSDEFLDMIEAEPSGPSLHDS